jgi:hypothetical protein
MVYEKPLQQRRTLEDTINYQDELLSLVTRKRERNTCLSFEEKEKFMKTYKRAVLSQGAVGCYFRTRNGKIVPFHHLTELAYYLSTLTCNRVDIIDSDTNHPFDRNLPISDLWKFFEIKLIYVFPYACDEASHMSAEAPIREQTTSYQFSSNKSVNEGDR